MVFSSFEFLFRFLPAFLLIYYITPKKLRNLVLFAGSIVFYMEGEAGHVWLLLASVAVNYFFGRLLCFAKEKEKGAAQKILLLFALCYNFGILIFYKYSGLAGALPLGISFYTFQITAYIIDVYRGTVPAAKSFVKLGTYLTMFPQLTAGPIINYAEVREQLDSRTVVLEDFEDGLKTLILGLGAKVVLADRIGLLWNQIQVIGFESISTPLAWIGAVAYSLELYFDFAGYSMMAIGLGKMLGFTIPVNFRQPYMSHSVSEFWRRWHITLGRWFKQYVYIPLGGNRKGKARTCFNLFVVWLLTALWHGAAPNFLIWGASLLFLLTIEKLFLLKFLEKHRILSHLYVWIVVPVTWVAFAVEDVSKLGVYMSRLVPFFTETAGTVNPLDFVKYINEYGTLFLLCFFFATSIPAAFYKVFRKKWLGNIGAAVILALSMYYLAISANNPFLYFNF